MIRAVNIRVLIAFVVISGLLIFSQTMPALHAVTTTSDDPEVSQTKPCGGKVTQTPPRVAVGVELVSAQSIDNVRPYRVGANRGDRVEWFSVDGDLAIEWQGVQPDSGQPVRKLPEVTCNGADKRGPVCFVNIPSDQPHGRYCYFALVKVRKGRTITLNEDQTIILNGKRITWRDRKTVKVRAGQTITVNQPEVEVPKRG